ncbi:MAG TPA: hypothetical protein DCZ94_19690 [Lentisphaeria bacterium]|nr:MAG: hypothetical protein A2X48_22470 [Lentisphaerae bacterium GWF2_49_21]HBC89168.1 hypothetical protein [Lentisphaeria bacterium]
MEAVKAITLSVILAISGWFNDGLKNLEAKKYDAAIADLTKVCEKDVPGNKFRELAFFFRAQAYFEKGDKEKAFADMIAMLRMQPGKELADQGRELYLKWGGAPEKLRPELSPKAVWAKFMEAAKKGDLKEVKELSTGKWKELYLEEMVGDDEDTLKAIHEQFSLFKPLEETIGENENAEKAFLTFQVQGGDITFNMGFVLDSKQNRWLISTIDEKFMRGEIDADMENLPQGNLNKLKQIGLALRMYSQEYKEQFPPKLDDLKEGGYLENEDMYIWTNSEDGKKFPFVYCPGLKESDSVEKMIVAAPAAVDGWREVLFIDGHAEKMDEEKFKEAAAKQGWKFKGLVKKEDIPAMKQDEIRALVKKLGDSDSTVRAETKKKIVKLGIDAFPVLEEFTNDPDPEIRLEVKNILKGK